MCKSKETFCVVQAVDLPPAKAWRVKDTDVAARGYVLCITKSKGLIFDKMTNLEPRLLTLTRSGLLIIYSKEAKGYVVDVKDAKVMTTKTDHFRTKRQSYRRCTMKLKFKYGSVSMIMFNEEIPLWRTAVSNAHDDLSTSKSPDGQDSAASINTCINAEGVIAPKETNSEVTVDMPEESEPATVVEAAQSSSTITKRPMPTIVITHDETSQFETFDPTVCDSSYQWLHKETKREARRCISDSSNSGLITELTDFEKSRVESAKSVRCGYTSVATLRSRLEARIQGRKSKRIPRFARSTALIQSQNASEASRLHLDDLPTIKSESPRPSSDNNVQPVIRSQSESDLDISRRRVLPPQTTFCDSTTTANTQIPELHPSPKVTPSDTTRKGTPAGKYNSNQWWAQPLRV
ncbi:unnamed protein product [Nippostrongylus brasiliensis]|uniref:PH domain-containing protein n=1 Tax=Nippostrongylus brasiliensis TaxID=27835 RepID=A0A0N4Y7Z1_NIPBR|nr:unnamed protein product [Nippostrongylus brasiliensis]